MKSMRSTNVIEELYMNLQHGNVREFSNFFMESLNFVDSAMRRNNYSEEEIVIINNCLTNVMNHYERNNLFYVADLLYFELLPILNNEELQ